MNALSNLLLPLPLNDVNINCSCSKLDEKYVTFKIQINDANELVELFFTATFALSFRSKLFQKTFERGWPRV